MISFLFLKDRSSSCVERGIATRLRGQQQAGPQSWPGCSSPDLAGVRCSTPFLSRS